MQSSILLSLAVVFDFSSFLFFKFDWLDLHRDPTLSQAGSSFTALTFFVYFAPPQLQTVLFDFEETTDWNRACCHGNIKMCTIWTFIKILALLATFLTFIFYCNNKRQAAYEVFHFFHYRVWRCLHYRPLTHYCSTYRCVATRAKTGLVTAFSWWLKWHFKNYTAVYYFFCSGLSTQAQS